MTVTDPLANVGTLVDEYTISIGHKCSANLLEFTDLTDNLEDYKIPYSGDGTGTACVDLDWGLLDSNNDDCAAYTSNGWTTVSHCGPSDVVGGFDAIAMCCACGGGYIAETPFTGHTAVSSLDTPLSTTDCPLTCKLQVYNEVTNVWQTYGESAFTPAYVDSFNDANNCEWNLITDSSTGSTYSPSDEDADIIYMRYMVYDENSDIGNSTYAVYDPFEITMNW